MISCKTVSYRYNPTKRQDNIATDAAGLRFGARNGSQPTCPRPPFRRPFQYKATSHIGTHPVSLNAFETTTCGRGNRDKHLGKVDHGTLVFKANGTSKSRYNAARILVYRDRQ